MFGFKKTASLEQRIAILEERVDALEAQNKALAAKLKNAGKSETKLSDAREEAVRTVMGKTGWSRETTIANIEAARKRTGCNYTQYSLNNLQDVPAEQQAQVHLDYLTNTKVKGKKARRARKNEKLLLTVIVNTGWDYQQAKDAMAKAEKISGAEYKDYVAYRFWELDDEAQKTYFTKGDANALRKKYNTNKDNLQFFMNKSQFNKTFAAYLGRPWGHIPTITAEEFKTSFAGEKKIIYKPLSDSCGHGVTVFQLTEENMEEVYDQLSKLPEGVVEGFVVQHPEMAKYSRQSVNTVRLVSLFDGKKVNPLYAVFRMGGGDAVVDNFHAGGVLAMIDVSNGTIITEAIDLACNSYANHPVTGEKILGFQIPYWTEILALIDKAGRVVDGVGYVGWDVAVTEKGPILIEGNTAPAPTLLQSPYARARKGMKHVVAKYL